MVSPFPCKVFSQDGDHPLQRPQHCSVDHHRTVGLSISTKKNRQRHFCLVILDTNLSPSGFLRQSGPISGILSLLLIPKASGQTRFDIRIQ